MSTNKETLKEIKDYLKDGYSKTNTSIIPKKGDLTFGNTVKKIKHTKVLYIDMRKSRKILSDATGFWSIKIHKSFLKAVTHCIEKRGGHIRSFNGDGILAFFVDDIDKKPASRAVRSAMDIKGFVLEINKILEINKKNSIDFGIGIAQGEIMVAKSGKGGDDQTKQDLIWIGLALYLAVELSELGKNSKNIWISHNVRKAIGIEKHLDIVSDEKGNSIWKKYTKNLKSVGEYEVRATKWHFNI